MCLATHLFILVVPSLLLILRNHEPVANMDGKSDSAIELIDKGSKQKNDANDMARLGKMPVLKVPSTSVGSSSA